MSGAKPSRSRCVPLLSWQILILLQDILDRKRLFAPSLAGLCVWVSRIDFQRVSNPPLATLIEERREILRNHRGF